MYFSANPVAEHYVIQEVSADCRHWDEQAIAFQKNGQFEEAIDCINHALGELDQEALEDQQKWFLKYALLERRMMLRKKLGQFEKIAEEIGELFEALHHLQSADAEIFNGYYQLAFGDPQAAEGVLQKEAAGDELSGVSWLLMKGAGLNLPTPAYVSVRGGDAHLREGLALFRSHHYNEAIAAFSLSSEESEGYYWRGVAKAMMDDFSGALEDYSLSEKAGNCRHDAEKAIVYTWMDRIDEAKALLKQAQKSSVLKEDLMGAFLLESILTRWDSAARVVFNGAFERQERVNKNKKPKVDEKKVREELVRVWTKVFDKYAKEGAYIPSPDEVRKELLHVGIEAGVKRMLDEHWWMTSFMVRGEIEEKVKKGLNKLDLPRLIEQVRAARNNPEQLNYLREQLKYHVLNC